MKIGQKRVVVPGIDFRLVPLRDGSFNLIEVPKPEALPA